VPDKGSLMVLVDARDPTQEPCRGCAVPSDQSPSHKSASAWPPAHSTTSEAAVKKCRSGAKIEQHAGWACRGQVRQSEGGCAGRGRRPPRIYRKPRRRRAADRDGCVLGLSMRPGASQCDKNAGCAGSAEDGLPDCRFAGKRTDRGGKGGWPRLHALPTADRK
jgi:hypothetical protein